MNRRLPAIALAIATFDLRRRVADPESVAQHVADIVQKQIVSGAASSITRWTVSATSVVLIAQI